MPKCNQVKPPLSRFSVFQCLKNQFKKINKIFGKNEEEYKIEDVEAKSPVLEANLFMTLKS